jgi:hypothetical protein
MHLGVRFSTSKRQLVTQFSAAMNFWAGIIEMEWHREDSRACAIQVLDGSPGLFKNTQAARAQFPGTGSFQGWIAFNPSLTSTPSELFVTAAHELGHLLGLQHSNNASSLMYFLRLDGPMFLDQTDLAALAARHKLRIVPAPTISAVTGIPGPQQCSQSSLQGAATPVCSVTLDSAAPAGTAIASRSSDSASRTRHP